MNFMGRRNNVWVGIFTMHLTHARHYAKSCIYVLSLQSHNEGAIISSILQIKKLRLSEVFTFFQSQTASRQPNWGYNHGLNSKLCFHYDPMENKFKLLATLTDKRWFQRQAIELNLFSAMSTIKWVILGDHCSNPPFQSCQQSSNQMVVCIYF